MQAAGVPVVPGETPDDQSDAALRRGGRARRLPGAGQGVGRRRRQGHADACASAARSPTPIQAARREAEAAFGDGTLYVERLDRTAAARRGAGLRRRARPRRAPVRARVLGAAAPPEGDRGEPVARARRRRCAQRMTERGGRGRARASATATPARSSSSSTVAATSARSTSSR